MPFRLLLDSPRVRAGWRATAPGSAMSFVAHAVLVGAAVAVTSRVPSVTLPERDFSPVEYLIPEERRAGLKLKEEHLTWLHVDAGGGLGFREAPVDRSDRKRLTVVVTPAEKRDDEADERPRAAAPMASRDSVLTELEVDSAVMRYPDSAAPKYPDALLRRHVEGSVLVQYIVDADGRPDSGSLRVLYASHPEFARAVRQALPRMRFRPAYVANRPVAQLVEQPFTFRVVDTTRARIKPPAR